MVLPPEWWAEAEEESILVGDVDEVGCIEISTLHKEAGVFSGGELRHIAEQESPQVAAWREVTRGDFDGWTASFDEDGAAIREWYLGREGMLLFVTYSCDEDNRGLDDAAVDEILDTLAVKA
nr:hypothetical protein [Parahaliea mediterranea]